MRGKRAGGRGGAAMAEDGLAGAQRLHTTSQWRTQTQGRTKTNTVTSKETATFS